MLNPEIQEFIQTLRLTHQVGCILVAAQDHARLLRVLDQSGSIVGSAVQKDRVTYYPLAANQKIPSLTLPALLIATEEAYAANPQWAAAIQEQAIYFLHVQG